MNIGIIGLGMIGGSMALAAKRTGWSVTGYDQCSETATTALNRQMIDAIATSVADIGKAELIFLATPVRTYEPLFNALMPVLNTDSIITDSGSTKHQITTIAQQQLGPYYRRFVPAHPIAGKEKSGLAAADVDLFKDHLTIVCRQDSADDAADTVCRLWHSVGARTVLMTTTEHDRIFALISHLPHLLAYSLVNLISDQAEPDTLLQYAAGGFRDFSRIASSSPTMWQDICLSNRDHLLEAIACYQAQLSSLADSIKNEDAQSLSETFQTAYQLRHQWLNTLEK